MAGRVKALSVAARAALVAIALVAAAWAVVSLMALSDLESGQRDLAHAADGGLQPAAVAHANAEFARARRWNGDATVLLRQSGTLYFVGRTEEAAEAAAQATRAEPENADAWAMLAVFTRGSDPARSREARRRALGLDPFARTPGQ